MSLLVALLITLQANSQQPIQKQSKQEPAKPAFDPKSLEKTATYFTALRNKVAQEERQAEASGNRVAVERLLDNIKKELSDLSGTEVSWVMRVSTVDQFGIKLEDGYQWKTGSISILAQYDNRKERQGLEPWMEKLKKGDLVQVDAEFHMPMIGLFNNFISLSVIHIHNPVCSPFKLVKKK